MASIVDTLLVEIGLDVKKFERGQRDVQTSMGKTKAELDKHAKDMEASAKRVTGFFKELQLSILGVFAAFTAGRGLKDFHRRHNGRRRSHRPDGAQPRHDGRVPHGVAGRGEGDRRQRGGHNQLDAEPQSVPQHFSTDRRVRRHPVSAHPRDRHDGLEWSHPRHGQDLPRPRRQVQPHGPGPRRRLRQGDGPRRGHHQYAAEGARRGSGLSKGGRAGQRRPQGRY